MPTPLHQRTDKIAAQVKLLAQIGVGERHIARIVGLNVRTVSNYYGDELEAGLADGIGSAAKLLASAMLKGNLTAAIFFLKCKGGWNERGETDKPLTSDELRAIAKQARAEIARRGVDISASDRPPAGTLPS